ncbi:MAG: sulfotransferase family protein [Solirubrobacteraceae bacterium]
MPDFFIVGHAKSGTTALYRMLRRHPQLYMPVKEPWFFADELQPPTPPRAVGTGRTPKTLEEYVSLFDAAAPEQLIGEASCLYLWSRTAASRIAEAQPAARIVAVLREPASFLRSLHLQFVQVHLEPEKDLRKAISLEQARREGRNLPPNQYWPNASLYSEHVRYVEQLRRYHDRFPPEQVLVLIYEDFRRDNEATVRKLQRFLGVDDTAPVVVTDANPTVRIRSPHLYALVHALAAGDGAVPRAVQRAARTLAPRRLTRESAVAIRDRFIFGRPQPVDESLMVELRRRFKPEVQALGEYLDRDLVSFWGYDDID